MTLDRRMTLTAAAACVLTSTVLYPLFISTAWLYAGAGAVIAVAASGALSRLRVLPAAVCLAISVLGLLLYLNVVFEPHHSWLGVIPTPTSIAALWNLAGAGMTESRIYGSPVPNLAGLLLLAAAGIGITAVLTDLIAVRLRSAALAGLPLLVLFTVPVTMKAPSGVGTVLVFGLGAAGYLAILSADGRERIRVWGKLVSLWRSGSLYEGARRGRARVAAAGNGAAVAAAGNGAAVAAAGVTGSGQRIPGPEPGPDTRALAAAGRRVGLASILLALCVPLVIPGLHPGKLFSSGPGIGGSGTGGALAPPLPDVLAQTLTQLQDHRPTTVLTYTTTARKSLQQEDPQYLRQYVLDVLTPNAGWQTSDYTAGSMSVSLMPALPPGLTNFAAISTASITVNVDNDALSSSSERTFLPILYPPTSVVASGAWQTDPDQMVFSQASSATVSSYIVNGDIVDPTWQELNEAAPPPREQLKADLQLPQSYQVPALKQIADVITKGDKTEYEKVEALASWLSGSQFKYSPAAKLFDTPAGLVNFLRTTRAGVCVQSAYAMTVLTRLLDIPARVVEGYTSGTPTSGGKYVVKTSDAHAWSEVYFAGYGWLRFEPTPSGQGTASDPNYMSSASGPGGTAKPPVLPPAGPSALPAAGPTKPVLPGVHPIPDNAGSVISPAGKSAAAPWAAVVLAVIVAIALVCGVIAVVAPPAHRALSSHQADARSRRPATLTTALLVTAAAAIVVLALYRVLSHTSRFDLRPDWATVGIAFGAACAVTLVTPAVGRIGLRRWRWIRATDDTSRAHTAWREFRDDLEDFGVGYRPSEPPRTLAERVTSGLPEPARAAIRGLALAEERASYAARPSGSATLRRDGAAARRGIAGSVPRANRWRARIFPASVLTGLADAAGQISDRVAALVSRRWTERRSAS
jgi:transglutaminase-like putative cysteine protease